MPAVPVLLFPYSLLYSKPSLLYVHFLFILIHLLPSFQSIARSDSEYFPITSSSGPPLAAKLHLIYLLSVGFIHMGNFHAMLPPAVVAIDKSNPPGAGKGRICRISCGWLRSW